APPTAAETWLNFPPYLGSDGAEVDRQAKLYQKSWYWLSTHWIGHALGSEARLREKMVLFWMNHFVISASKVFFPQVVYRFIDSFRRNPWGNFRQMVK